MALIYNATFDSQTRVLLLLDKAGNVISSCEVPSKELVDDPKKPLMLRAIKDNSSVTLTKKGTLSNTYQTSTNGTDWTDYTLGTRISLNKGESVYFRCSNHPTTQTSSNYVMFVMRGKIEAWHNAYSMISSDFSSAEVSVGEYGMGSLFKSCSPLTKAPLLLNALEIGCYYSMFQGCTSLVQAPELPATTIANSCYLFMFKSCKSITKAPELPATTLAQACYGGMFNGCTSLTKATELPATTLAPSCYSSMFNGCTSLTQAPSLPATTIVHGCYNSMFQGCTSLTQAPELPATTLAQDCYRGMFIGCTSLTQATELPATTLAPFCYEAMFMGCSSLTQAPELPATALAERCCLGMFSGCTSLTQAPELPAKTLDQSCYAEMFKGCTSLAQAPSLPATALADSCYASMFGGCTSLAQAPSLPATALADSCYASMFGGCTSLAQAPSLPATALADFCYFEMFKSCRSLREVRIAATSDAINALANWLSGVAATGDFYCDPNATIFSTDSASGIPKGWTRVNEGAPAVDDPNKPLMLRAIEDNSSVTLKKVGTLSNTYQTSTNGKDWTDYTLGTKINLSNEDVVYFRCSNHPTTQDDSNHVQFVMAGRIEAWHNAYSMISSSFTDTEDSVGMFGMINLFNECSSLTKAPLLLNTLGKLCYSHTFRGCTSLTQAPSLPATNLENYCYFNMFSGCRSLAQAPSLPATNLADACYSYMFEGCRSLAQAPSLPATNLANDCYSHMFDGCTSLTQAPSLPATNLAIRCYSQMFDGCTSLTQAPSLPATNLAVFCYSYMFFGCSNLKEVRVSATTTATDALINWLSGVSATGDFYCDPNATIFPSDNVSGIPSGWTRRDINLLNALTLTATADNSSVKLTKNGTLDNTFEVDKGNGWEDYAIGTVIPLNAGQSCKLRCKSHPTTQSDQNYVQFVMTGKIKASGNVNSMLSRGFENLTSLSGYDYAFNELFKGCTSLTQAPSLPATNLETNCYYYMFKGCTSLTKAPSLPATALASNCYAFMFYGCTSLTQAPSLPAMTLANCCYRYMFNDCTSLTIAPSLPATTLAHSCYEYMFEGCTSLTKAPSLPATALAEYCYAFMFYGCTSLVQAPSLPAMTLANFCYHYMFTGCTPLNEVRISATTTATGALEYWLADVSATGDFYCDPNATIFPADSASGIPKGWTRHALSDYPVNP